MKESRKRVSFLPRVSVRKHLHLNDMTDEELSLSYYREQELATMRHESMKIIKLLNAGIEKGRVAEEKNGLCYRGLEFSTKVGAHLRAVHKYTAWDVVEFEQERQWERHQSDSDVLASVYHMCTEDSAVLAHLLALQDAEGASVTSCIKGRCSPYCELILSLKKLDNEAELHQQEVYTQL